MFFEDIFNKLKTLWKDTFSLSKVDESETFIQELLLNYQEIEYHIDFVNKKDFTEWDRMMAFSMYQALTAYGINKWKEEKSEILNFNEVSKDMFEHYFRTNLEAKGNEVYLKKYKGFR